MSFCNFRHLIRGGGTDSFFDACLVYGGRSPTPTDSSFFGCWGLSSSLLLLLLLLLLVLFLGSSLLGGSELFRDACLNFSRASFRA